MQPKRILTILLAAFFLTGVVIWVYLRLTTATIAISSSVESSLFVRVEGDTEFKDIGQGNAVFKTRSENRVFIEARMDEQVTQKSVLPKRRDTVEVSLKIKPLAKFKYIGSGPLIYPFLSSGFIYGINPHTNSLTVKPIDGNRATLPPVQNLPYLKQIIWSDRNNYFYVTLGQGAGFISNGKINASSGAYIAAASAGNQLALLSSEGLYLTPKNDPETSKKISTLVGNSAPNVFADENGVYLMSLIYNPSQDEGDEPTAKETQITGFDLRGNKKFNFTLPITEQAYKVTSLDDSTLAILSPAGINVLDVTSGQSQVESFDFGQVADILTYQKRTLLLGGEGLWEYNKTKNEYYKLASYNEGEEYVPNSLTNIGKSIYFSTSIKEEEFRKSSTSARNSIYKVDL